MEKAKLLILALSSLFCSFDISRASDFLKTINHIPLMPGLIENPETALIFETPSGRIVEVSASGRLDQEHVIGFYEKTLPELGWGPLLNGEFFREDEVLKLKLTPVTRRKGFLKVHFKIAPKHKE